jgi:hypothetical protein
MMITSFRLLPALGLLLAGCVAADAWHKRAKARNAKADLSHEIKTWEGEGGNLPGSTPASTPASAETSLASSAP